MTFTAFDLLLAFTLGVVLMWMMRGLADFIRDWRSTGGKEDNESA